MVRAIKFIAAVLIALSILVEIGWIRILNPQLEHIHQLLFKGARLILNLFFP